MATANTITIKEGGKDAAKLLSNIFTKSDRIYFAKGEVNKDRLSKGVEYDFEFPVIAGTFKINEGDPSTTEVKTTYQSNIISKVTQGDSDCAMQIASTDPSVLALFKTQDASEVTVAMGGVTYSGYGYSSDVKKVSGAIIGVSDDKNSIIIVTNVDMYGGIVTDDGDNPLYINVKFTFKDNADGDSFIVLNKQS